MDIIIKNPPEKCFKHLGGEVISTAILNGDAETLEKINSCMRQVYKEAFFSKIILPQWLLSATPWSDIAEESFGKSLRKLLEKISMEKLRPKNKNYESSLFVLFKDACFELIAHCVVKDRHLSGNAGLWKQATPDSIAIIFYNRLEKQCRDYFLWYYIDRFNTHQVSVITNMSTDEVKKNLWACRQVIEDLTIQMPGAAANEKITEEEFFSFCEYFENILTNEEENRLRQLVNENSRLQKHFELELSIRYGINKSEFRKSLSLQPQESFLSADDFIRQVKGIIESAE